MYLGETGRPRQSSSDDSESDNDVVPGSYQNRKPRTIRTRDSGNRANSTSGRSGSDPDTSRQTTALANNARGSTDTQDPPQTPHSRGTAPEEPYAIPPFDEVLGNVHEKAMAEAGFGRLQWLLLVILGLGLMGDGIEMLMIAYILPGAEKDLCMDDQMKGWLGESLDDQMKGWLGESLDDQMKGWLGESLDDQMKGWLGKSMDDQMKGWLGESLDD